MIQRKIESTDGANDRLVYELYGLTYEKIKIVEGTPSGLRPPPPNLDLGEAGWG